MVDEIRLSEWLEQPTVGIRQVVRLSDLPTVFAWAIPAAARAMQRIGVTPAGAPYARYRGHLEDEVDVEVGFAVADPVPPGDLQVDLPAGSRLVVDHLPAVRAAQAVHIGAYEGLRDTYARIESWAAARDLRPLGDSWEVYEAGPDSDPDPATWRTTIVMPMTAPAIEAH